MNALLRIIAWALALALVALPVVAVVNGWIGAERWPLRTLRVGGEMQRVDPQQLRTTVLPFAQRGFFAIRLADAQAAVAKLPWVERAEVRKRWPDVLEVRVIEHRPFAQLGQGPAAVRTRPPVPDRRDPGAEGIAALRRARGARRRRGRAVQRITRDVRAERL